MYPPVNVYITMENIGKSPFSMGKSTISMVIFNSYVKLPEGNMVQPASYLGIREHIVEPASPLAMFYMDQDPEKLQLSIQKFDMGPQVA